MNSWFLQQVTNEERENILSKHRELYNGYQTMQPKVSNTQPLYVQDFAKDKVGVTVNTKGEYVPFTNKINEQFDQHMTEEKGMCSECGGSMYEGECSECGWKGNMEEVKEDKGDKKEKPKGIKSKFSDWMSKDEDTKLEKAMKKIGDFLVDLEDKIDGVEKKAETKESFVDFLKKRKTEKTRQPYEAEAIEKVLNIIKNARTEEHLDSAMKIYRNLEDMYPKLHDVYRSRVMNAYKRKADELGVYLRGVFVETKGHLDDIYKEKDLNLKGHFDYVEGGDNYEGSFEQMHGMKEDDDIEISAIGAMEEDEHIGDKHISRIEPPYNFKSDGPSGDGGTLRQKNIKEGGFTGGGNAPDFDLDNVDPAFNFKSKGPEEDTFTVPADDMDLDKEKEWDAFDFKSGGGNENGGDVYPVYEEMKSAWDEEIDEVDVSGSQGVYSDTEKPYAFVSSGPGKAGPYQTNSWGGEQLSNTNEEYESEDEDAYWEKDLEPGELELDYEKFNPTDKSWFEITAHTGEDEFSHMDEDIKEKFLIQKEKVNEMMERMKRFN